MDDRSLMLILTEDIGSSSRISIDGERLRVVSSDDDQGVAFVRHSQGYADGFVQGCCLINGRLGSPTVVRHVDVTAFHLEM